MLRSFTLQNFQSFREPFRISFELNGHAPDDDRSAKIEAGQRLSKAVAIIGPNASGKTTLIKSLAFMDWFMKHSFNMKHDERIPLSAHFTTPNETSEFEMEFELDGKEWRYRLNVSPERVYSESLHVKQSRVYSYVFTRDWDPARKGYIVKQQQFGLLQKEAEKVRENASLISTASQYDVELALKLTSTLLFSNVNGLGRNTMDPEHIFRASEYYAKNADIRNQMAALLKQWDFGLSDVRLEKRTVTRENGQTEEIYVPIGVHKIGEQEHLLLFLQESSGTQGAFCFCRKFCRPWKMAAWL